jgi:hypothetical protein
MAGENTASVTDVVKDKEGDGDARQRSTIGFPYNNLDDAIEVAQAIHANVGTGDCDDSQLSAWMKLSPKSSGYRVQVSASRMFGLIEGGAAGYKLSALGRMIVDPQRQREARVKSFLTVPLYKAVFEKYKGGVMPPPAALERDIVGLGVAEKQKERARQVLERSAEQAGFFAHGRDRLVMPGIAAAPDVPPTPPAGDTGNGKENEEGKPGGGSGGGDGERPVDPIIKGLLARLPPTGHVWPDADRKLWLQLLEGSFKLIYKDKDESAN